MKFALTDLTLEELKKATAAIKGKGKVEETDDEETDDDADDEDEDDPKPAKGKKGKKKPADDEDEESDDDESDDDDGPTLEVVIKGFKKFVKENDRKAANAILKKFKVTSVSDLDEKDYPKVLKMLK